ncbi:copper resistance system multicopper oxidase [Thiohalomonas denitrificans]|uniref:Copper-resistance protein, CopA family n=1 Tax=Thiohalomonas denitrificans TaxID=415747 RepID=A0A1G5QC15_9GAMM|nr:copper resistance system multicopper oxidase [Thiohalomonas denitrificans]SCZ59030.1 copper-resistance protein, CopA family [Thiohalomonas denitrificans]
MQNKGFSRRNFLKSAVSVGVLAGLNGWIPAYASQREGLDPTSGLGHDGAVDLAIERTTGRIAGERAQPITINGTTPGPLIRLKEGTIATLRVTNLLDEATSIHWHGILLPFQMDGVPGVSFPGIPAGETFTYRYPLNQSGTYWYHSHSGLQEQLGHYGPLVIDPAEPEPFEYDRDYVVMLSDWTFEDPMEVLKNLKKAEGYYNYQKRTVADFFRDVEEKGWGPTMRDRRMWGNMRMSPTDIADVTGSTYTFLLNGMAPEENWTALFNPGEKVRLRFINGSAMSYFDVRIPGLKMTVVQADGQNTQPVPVDEFRIGIAETYDVIVEPDEDRAYTLFAESMNRSGFARGTLSTRDGDSAAIPKRRPAPVRGMDSMGMDMDMDMDMDMEGSGSMDNMDSSGSMASMEESGQSMDMNMDMGNSMEEMNPSKNMASMENQGESMNMDGPAVEEGQANQHAAMDGMVGDSSRSVEHGPNNHGPGAAMVAMNPRSRLDEPGVGLESTDSHRVLVYSDLKSLHPWPDQRKPGREIELHLTGNMERYMWSFDGKKFSEVKGPVRFHHGERLRLTLVNDTMMDHPIHLHGMWMELDTGAGPLKPRKHTISVKPGEKVSAQITADAPGDWAFHCHLLYHMKAGMFRVVSVA